MRLITKPAKPPKAPANDLSFCWAVLFKDGHKEYFTTEESAKACAALYGIGLTAPLYR